MEQAEGVYVWELLGRLGLPASWVVQAGVMTKARFHRTRYHGWPLREEEVDAILEALHAFGRRLLAVTRGDIVSPTVQLIPRGRERRSRR